MPPVTHAQTCDCKAKHAQIIRNKIAQVAEQNSYRGKVNQTAQWGIELLESVLKELA